MHFLLIHSPLVTSQIWSGLTTSLQATGHHVSVAALDNDNADGRALFQHHIRQIELALALAGNEKVIAVAHSGAGNLLAYLDPDQFEGHVFLDAIFPIENASRFDLFSDPAAVQSWREMAHEHAGMLPKSMLTQLAGVIEDEEARRAFIAETADVPVKLYEESIPVHRNWPRSKHGLYVQWTDSYGTDAARADKAGFAVRRDEGTHFEMVNRPDEVALVLAGYALTDGT